MATWSVAFLVSARANGVDVVGVVSSAIENRDINALQWRLFQATFAGFGFDAGVARDNFRHEMMIALLVALVVSAWAVRVAPWGSRFGRWVLTGSYLGFTGLVLVSVSRSAIAAAAVWPALAAFRTARRGGLTRWRIAQGCAAAVVVVVAMWGDAFGLVADRILADTASYEGRIIGLQEAFAVVEHSALGGGELTRANSHVFPIDMWVYAGVVPFLLSIVVVCGLAISVVRAALDDRMPIPVVVAGSVLLLRMFTVGHSLHMADWLGFALFAGVWAAVSTPTAVRRSHGRHFPTHPVLPVPDSLT